MKLANELVRQHHIKMMAIAATGGGKTYLGGTFPKGCFLSTEPGGMTTIAMNPHLKKNLIVYDEFVPKTKQDTKAVLEAIDKACDEAREMAIKGEIETLILDNLTYYAQNKWEYINEFEPLYSSKTGELDTRGMYGKLGRSLYQFVLMKLLSCPCHIVVTVHEKLEDEDALRRKPDKSFPIVPYILGGFRDMAGGLFSCVFYLSCYKGDDKKYHYKARTMKGNKKNAKNRYNLPEVIENISYNTIIEAIRQVEAGRGRR